LIDPILILAGVLSAMTVGAAIEYYWHLRGAQSAYRQAKSAVEDMILSFNRELQHESSRIDSIAYQIEVIAAKTEGAGDRTGETMKKIATLETNVGMVSESREKILQRLEDAERTIRDVTSSQDTLVTRITGMEGQIKQVSLAPETRLEAAIPIRRDKALAQLTPTELSALELLVSEGPKTAPEIKEKVGLSREHTARLMKKLYEEGYLERETGKIPFRYSVKKEMENLLRKADMGSPSIGQ
jgi:chromosome segregation ATPase